MWESWGKGGDQKFSKPNNSTNMSEYAHTQIHTQNKDVTVTEIEKETNKQTIHPGPYWYTQFAILLIFILVIAIVEIKICCSEM